MMKITRPQTPKVLAENWEKWGKTYETGNLDFSWQIDKINVRNEILELLREMTTDHCSYCDGFPMESMLGDTVDHFKPKSIYPKEAYKWENLFLCCNICQKRINQYQDALLKPDEIEYEFSNYFFYNTENGELEPNKLAGSANQERAKYTIKIFKLNEYNRPNSRKMFFRKFAKDTNPTVDEYPYRFILQ
jgi:uncharacterized protein (TIGR02646 family)